jgi:fluoride exporter
LERYLLVMAGAAAGALARYIIGTAIAERYGTRFPFGTLVVNVSGSFLIGILMAVLSNGIRTYPLLAQYHTHVRLLLIAGVLGGYTTFSTFSYETFGAARDGGALLGLVNVLASVGLGLIAAWCGLLIGERL